MTESCFNPFSLSGKNILVTGASSGIGRQCAIDFSRAGANVFLLARNRERLTETLSMMGGDDHEAVSLDLTDYDRRTLEFAKDYSNELLAIDVNIGITQMLDTAWTLFRKYFTKAELGIKQEIVDEFGNYKD